MSEGRPLLSRGASWLLTLSFVALVAVAMWTLLQQNRQLRQALGGEFPGGSDQASLLSADDQLAPVKLRNTAGEQRTLTEIIRPGTVLAVFNTTCPYCELSLPAWRDMDRSVRAKGGQLLGISLHSVAITEQYVREHEISWPVWILTEPASASELKLRGVPTTAVVGASGNVAAVLHGALLRPEESEPLLDAALAAARLDDPAADSCCQAVDPSIRGDQGTPPVLGEGG